jgi:hypothetical protein
MVELKWFQFSRLADLPICYLELNWIWPVSTLPVNTDLTGSTYVVGANEEIEYLQWRSCSDRFVLSWGDTATIDTTLQTRSARKM